MTSWRISRPHLRFAVKLATAIVLALFVGFRFELETPRWAVLTAAVVAAGPAFAAGGEPYSGAIRYRGMLRVAGTFLGSIVALVLVIGLIRAPVILLLVCCIWAGFCTWMSSISRVANSYGWGLSGYTALIVVVSAKATPLLTPQYAVERCCEIVIGIVCAIVADLIFSPRSIKQEIDRELDSLLVDQYRLMQSCLQHSERYDIDKNISEMIRRTEALEGMRDNLKLESSRWALANRRLKAINSLLLTLITQASETWLIQDSRLDYIPARFRVLLDQPVENMNDVHQHLKQMRRLIATAGQNDTPDNIYNWVRSATRCLLLRRGFVSNVRISAREEEVLQGEPVPSPHSAEHHQARVNFLRTSVAAGLGVLFWLWTDWNSGAGCITMIAIVTSLAMRTPNPRLTALDFVFGMILAVPVGGLFYLWVMPNSQQSMLLLCMSFAIFGVLVGIAVQRRRLGALGSLTGIINILVLNNPMSFQVEKFIDGALGQVMGVSIAYIVIAVIRDKSTARTGQVLLNQFVSSAVSALTTRSLRRRENHLPALYQQLFLLMSKFPDDIDKFRLALRLIIAHQRLRSIVLPASAELSDYHRHLRETANRVTEAKSDTKRRHYYQRLLTELGIYLEKLKMCGAPLQVTELVTRLVVILNNYQHVMTDS
ncbi:p-hydroxybenzoic acid efflux pump subunit AaeB [Salmonella enterica subsp. enterica serovar Choleraesuis]|nr:p-hydroxybenzoic acid efflux pump subunit AaeB [Salmonella enterica subsp. enterica serovar Choleraesuis]